MVIFSAHAVSWRHRTGILALVCIVLLSSGCSQADTAADTTTSIDTTEPGSAAAVQQDGTGEQPSAAAADEPPEPIRMERTAPARSLPREQNDTSEAPPASPPDQAYREIYREADRRSPVYPYDTELDNLQQDEHPARAVIQEFLEGVLQQDFRSEHTAPDERFLLRLALEPVLEDGLAVTRYRLGRIVAENGQHRLGLRLFNEQASAVGELFLVLKDDQWYITDISFPWEQLESSRPAPRFEPATHQWTIGTQP
ncbi:hypothetical protein [Spirochaeta africana]|uniref:DUF3828 domain-containing protein n=1 Tax=Spirochaeta africana (strain ATCC 700263 / DSM 8902 / Z-7692) TaxID=889378 RepID=H9UHS2_SPIAZ|nr:hypothetical protein [Spirochaeta africana]AFG37065.1 hypothetical protein Spiaf_0977 [Spirochaeta africana DSM 8902]